MLPLSRLVALVVIICSRRVFAQLQPTAPGPNETYTAGSNCSIAWNPDTSGSWTNVTIDLMSGSNNNMSAVTNVVNGLDGTDESLTPYSWTCPEVEPYSNIYFYEFTNGDDISTRAWTTRFTIASPLNETELPESLTQPDGESIPWGIGHLLGGKSVANTSANAANRSGTRTHTHTLHSATWVASPSGSAYPSASAPPDRKKSHGHNPGDADEGPREDRDGESGDGSFTERHASRTRPANTAAAKSAAARATGVVQAHSSASSGEGDDGSDGPASNARGRGGKDDSDQSDPSASEGTNTSYPRDGGAAQAAQSSVSDSSSSSSSSSSPKLGVPTYKTSGEADAADSDKDLDCHCGGFGVDHANGATGVTMKGVGVVSPVVITLVVLSL